MLAFFCVAVSKKCPLSLSKYQISYQHLLLPATVAFARTRRTRTHTHLHAHTQTHAYQYKTENIWIIYNISVSVLSLLLTFILFAFSICWLQTVLWYKCRFSPFATCLHSHRCTDCGFSHFREPQAAECVWLSNHSLWLLWTVIQWIN